MLLGIECLEIYEFFSARLLNNNQTAQSRFSSTASFSPHPGDSLSKVCHSYLLFAEETFKTALRLIVEQEQCCCQNNSSSVVTIDQHWEKGQHSLLRGRAHHNIGRAMYEMAHYYKCTPNQQSGKRKPKDLQHLKLQRNNRIVPQPPSYDLVSTNKRHENQ